jgi:hypothetical protein
MSDTPPLDRLAGCEMMLTQDGTLKVTLLMNDLEEARAWASYLLAWRRFKAKPDHEPLGGLLQVRNAR